MSERDIIDNTGISPITMESLTDDFKSMGIKKGITLLVHSSLSKLGWVCGNAVAVINALLSVLGDEGTLVMPSHSGDLSDPKDWVNPPVPESWHDTIRDTMPAFDPYMTPTRGMGIIAETFRKMKGVLRSSHPQVSFSAYGKHAEFITSNHTLDYSLGNTSPLAKVYELDGDVLLLGVDHDNNTSLHLSEYRADYPSKKEKKLGTPLIKDEVRIWTEFTDINYDDEDFINIGKDFYKTGKIIIGKTGNTFSQLFSQKEIVDFSVKWIEKNRR